MGLRIGFIGRSNAGKDEAANALEGFSIVRVGFADPIKDAIRAAFPDIVFSLYGKNEIIPELGKSQRELWQLFGDGFGRNGVHHDVWIDRLFRRIEKFTGKHGERDVNVVVTDVRRINEAQCLLDRGYSLYKIVDPHWVRSADWQDDASETDVDMLPFSCVIENDKKVLSLADFHAEVRRVLGLR